MKKNVEFQKKKSHLRYEPGRREDHLLENRVPMANVRFRVLRSETEHRTELSRTTLNRYQQTRREPYTSSIQGNMQPFFSFFMQDKIKYKFYK